MFYTKKPVKIEAHLFNGNLANAKFIEEWSEGVCSAVHRANRDKSVMFIVTLEGTMSASVGDYIIKGVKGEFYPCKPDIFELTYDLVPLEEQI